MTAIAEKIVELLLLQIRKQPVPAEGTYIQPEFIVRDSFYTTQEAHSNTASRA